MEFKEEFLQSTLTLGNITRAPGVKGQIWLSSQSHSHSPSGKPTGESNSERVNGASPQV